MSVQQSCKCNHHVYIDASVQLPGESVNSILYLVSQVGKKVKRGSYRNTNKLLGE